MFISTSALSVVEQILLSFNKPCHLANDTVFIFQSGHMLFASRSILAIQCPKISPLLFLKEGTSVLANEIYLIMVTIINFCAFTLTDRFPVTVAMTITGQSTLYYVHPSEYVVDLKEKISLAQGYSVTEQNLIFEEKPLIDSATLSSCGVGRAAVLILMLVGSSSQCTLTTYFTSVLNPSLSISHFSLGLRLDSLVANSAPISPPNLANQRPLPSHLSHIVHVHDVPFEAFQMLLVYLYCRNLMEPSNCKWAWQKDPWELSLNNLRALKI